MVYIHPPLGTWFRGNFFGTFIFDPTTKTYQKTFGSSSLYPNNALVLDNSMYYHGMVAHLWTWMGTQNWVFSLMHWCWVDWNLGIMICFLQKWQNRVQFGQVFVDFSSFGLLAILLMNWSCTLIFVELKFLV